jgi:hypothetical protein
MINEAIMFLWTMLGPFNEAEREVNGTAWRRVALRASGLYFLIALWRG